MPSRRMPDGRCELNFESLVSRLRRSSNVDGVMYLGSTGQPTLNVWSDRDLLIVLNESELPITNGTIFCDNLLVDLVFIMRQEIERLIETGLNSIVLSDVRASVINWVSSGKIVEDKSGCLGRLREALERVRPRPTLTEGEAINRADNAIYNLAQTQRMADSTDPVYEQAIDLRMLRQLADLVVDYFAVRGLLWRGEKEAIRYWGEFDPSYLTLFMQCCQEQRRGQRIRIYAQLVGATIAPVSFAWDPDGVNLVLFPASAMTRENLEKARSYWQTLTIDNA